MFVKYESQEEMRPMTHSGMENKQKYHELLLETNIKITIFYCFERLYPGTTPGIKGV